MWCHHVADYIGWDPKSDEKNLYNEIVLPLHFVDDPSGMCCRIDAKFSVIPLSITFINNSVIVMMGGFEKLIIQNYNTILPVFHFTIGIWFYRRLHIYPNGDSSKNRHLSIYLELMETSTLPAGWEVNVIFNFLIYNKLQDKYDSIQGQYEGFHKFLSLHKLKDPKQGFLADDTCILEAEVTVLGLIGTA
ncbi:MATH domain and coiled-coil domain-containing protein At3g58250-like [Pistacia vera]|uniref:MATH domain and coiled-coil domain-containing protein At3g58250-like n=1 Tax=Pistacia vera TaxID=55513 RepID=UPI001262B2D5|nr:MATH domain and coiled-coil domain-containing protein At3g58250-like [Pistacia vera]